MRRNALGAAKFCFASLLGVFCLGSEARAEKTRIPSTNLLGSISYARDHQPDPEDKFYRKYFGNLDPDIERNYQDRWRFHDMQLPYALASWGYEHLSLGSLNARGYNQPEWVVREQFASHVLRMRVQSGLRELFAGASLPKVVRGAQTTFQAIDSVRNASVSLSTSDDTTATPVEVRYGYDMITDNSKLEFVRGDTMLGFYHPQLVSSIFGYAPRFTLASVRLSTSFGERKTRKAGLGYRWGDSVVEGSLSDELKPGVTARLAGAQSINPAAPYSSVYAEVAFRIDFLD